MADEDDLDDYEADDDSVKKAAEFDDPDESEEDEDADFDDE
jgi:hypothetical protein